MSASRRLAPLRSWLLWAAGVRVGLGVLAIPLAPFLYEEHFLVLVLLRPTKEVLLAGGFLARRGDVPWWQLVAAAVPLTVLGVWHFYYLGRAFSSEIKSGRLPSFAERLLPQKKISTVQKVLKKKGNRLVFLSRLAAVSSAMVAAAAGSAPMKSREFLLSDGAGALLSVLLMVGLGFAAGEAYDTLGPWVTGGGVLFLAGGGVLWGRYISRI